MAAHLRDGDLSLAMIAAVQLSLSDIPEDRIEGLAWTNRLPKANFSPAEPRDPQGRWTNDGDASNVAPACSDGHSPTAASPTPRAWESQPNADFRNRLAIAEKTAQKAASGYGEMLDRADSQGRRHIALGRYQMTPTALQAAGMIDANGNWTEKYGIHSRTEFLTDPEAQENALTDYLTDTERQLRANGAFTHIGETIDGLKARFPVTRAGIVAAAHREGAPATRDYLNRIAGHGFPVKGSA